MRSFLRENWLWVLMPLLLAAAVLVFIAFFYEGDDVAPFLYNLGLLEALREPAAVAGSPALPLL